MIIELLSLMMMMMIIELLKGSYMTTNLHTARISNIESTMCGRPRSKHLCGVFCTKKQIFHILDAREMEQELKGGGGGGEGGERFSFISSPLPPPPFFSCTRTNSACYTGYMCADKKRNKRKMIHCRLRQKKRKL